MSRRTTRPVEYVLSVLSVAIVVTFAPLLLGVLAGRSDFAALLARHGLGSLERLVWAAAAITVCAVLVAIYQLRIARPADPAVFAEGYINEQRRQMLQQLDGVIEQLLNLFPYNVRRIPVHLEIRQDLVKTLLPIGETGLERRPAPQGGRIATVFDEDARGLLLILGNPGSGKTTLLLELAQDLLGRAKQNADLHIPVLFFLSRWTPAAADLARWLAGELKEVYKVPRALADYWVDNDRILPLLDGLDEVAADHRQACLEAVNNFRDAHGLVPLAVSSRLQDYERMEGRLQLSRAAVIQPLAEAEIRDYLESAPGATAGLAAAFESDPTLMELLNTPLWLGFMMRALEAPGEWQAVETGSLELRRHGILTRCINSMLSRYKPDDALAEREAGRIPRNVKSIFRRRAPDARYSREDVLRWLSSLASSMARANRIPFYLEDLGVEWLPTPGRRATAIWAARLVFGLVFGLLGGSIMGLCAGLFAGPFYGLIGWLAGGLGGAFIGGVAACNGEKPSDRLTWSFRETRSLLGVSLLAAPAGALVIWLAGQWLGGFRIGLSGSLVMGLAFGLFLPLVFGFTPREISARARPNEGTAQSGWNGVLVGLVVGLILGTCSALARSLAFGLGHGRIAFAGASLSTGLVFFLFRGGSFFLSHWFVRLILRLYGYAPFRYVRFLDYATGRLFLKRAGAGYLFAHRVLMEYFLSEEAISHRPSASG